jgi:hypothetical protein
MVEEAISIQPQDVASGRHPHDDHSPSQPPAESVPTFVSEIRDAFD